MITPYLYPQLALSALSRSSYLSPLYVAFNTISNLQKQLYGTISTSLAVSGVSMFGVRSATPCTLTARQTTSSSRADGRVGGRAGEGGGSRPAARPRSAEPSSLGATAAPQGEPSAASQRRSRPTSSPSLPPLLPLLLSLSHPRTLSLPTSISLLSLSLSLWRSPPPRSGAVLGLVLDGLRLIVPPARTRPRIVRTYKVHI